MKCLKCKESFRGATNRDNTCPLCGALVSAPCSAPRILRLTLKRKWFDMIASGEKREEYRVPGKWILSRLEGKDYDKIEFRNGYGDVPTIEVEYLGWSYGTGRPEWGGTGERVAVIYIGRILKQNGGAISQAKRS